MSRTTGGMGTRMFAVMMAVGLSACTTGTITGRGWIPNAPGDVPAEKEEVARRPSPPPPARTAAAPAAPAAEPATSPFRAPPAGPAAPRTAPAASAPAPASAASPASAAGGYTQATRYGDLLFLSGQIAIDPRTNQMVGDKVEDQTRQVMENIRQVLEANRLTMANVVSVTVYMRDINQFRAMDDVYDTFFKTALPSRSVVEVARLPRGALIEMTVVAGR